MRRRRALAAASGRGRGGAERLDVSRARAGAVDISDRVGVMTDIARGTFDITMTPGETELGGAVSRFELAKTFQGDLRGSGVGLMLSAGDPRAGAAGYVAMEIVRGHLGGREGGFALQQFGTMRDGAAVLHYEVVPGSGTGRLTGITGTLRLDDDGTHRYELEYDLDHR